MADIKVVGEKSINMAQLKEAIKEIKKRDEELGFRTAKVSEYLDTVKVVKLKDAQEMFEKMEKLSIPRLKDVHINKIIDLMPQNMNELKNIIQGYALTITNDNLEKILKILEDYLPKKK